MIPLPPPPPDLERRSSSTGSGRSPGPAKGPPTVFRASDLCDLLNEYLESVQVKEVYRAYLFGAEAHEGQWRRSGEPYIYHPLAVARILAGMRLDYRSITAALLHDVIEDTGITKEHLTEEFGHEVAELVDGVSKLTQIKSESRAEAQAENFRKMIMAMARDVRVILIKLADRLHNMRTLEAMPPEKRRIIARETLEIFAPIAHRLGINNIRLELEDLGFAALYPFRYRVLTERVRKARRDRREITEKIENALSRRLTEEGMPARVIGREKHIYSIYQKMRAKGVSFSDVRDLYAFRIIVDRVDTCYRVLGATHNLYQPVPGRFKDYIAMPKANGYQSLHTTVVGPYGVHLEIQIRTEDMAKVADVGIAAHWLYKTGEVVANRAEKKVRKWLRGLLEIQKSSGNSIEFIENMKIDLFPDEVYIFTPRGHIMELPRGATPVDFAYAVHSDVGNRCLSAKIDHRIAPLSTVLMSGQQVEIIVADTARPNPSWLNFVVTAKARSNIRHYLKNLEHGEAVSLGQRMLEKAVTDLSLTLAEIPAETMAALLKELSMDSEDALMEAIGFGKRPAVLVARRLTQGVVRGEGMSIEPKASPNPLVIRGTEGMVVTYGKCCRPIPGDPIMGFVTAGRGIVVHTSLCKTVANYRNRPERWIDVAWEESIERPFAVEIKVAVVNRRGVLATIATHIAEYDCNIENIDMEDRDGQSSTLHFTLSVRDRHHLARIIRRVRGLPDVLRIIRVRR
ncbi:bifunctional (p)ppGpp synthase/hydrolase SpoT [Gammaproteobacteria bacterium]